MMTASIQSPTPRRKAVWGPKRTIVALALAALVLPGVASAAPKAPKNQSQHRTEPKHAKPGLPSLRVDNSKLDSFLKGKKTSNTASKETVDVIVTLNPGQDLPPAFKVYARRYFAVINAYEIDNLPVTLLAALEQLASVHRAHYNHSTKTTDTLSNVAIQAQLQMAKYGYTGKGVGVAFVDSGFTSASMPDLLDSRVSFVDFTHTNKARQDLNGHGTHVAGIVGATAGLAEGVAPETSITSLKVLDEHGQGRIGDIIAALNWVYLNGKSKNIRIVNMSVGAGVYESYFTDPLTLAAKALVDRGVVVVAAAGNLGKNAKGQLQWGGITSPAVAPWVITTCALSTNGTLVTTDDAVASFSSSGPTWIDFTAKPDVCAPGVGIVSLGAPEGNLFLNNPTWRVGPNGQSATGAYLSLSGTSMAAPFVSGTVALMLQANPKLTPNLVKAIIEYTATAQPNVSPLRQGAGFLNTLDAVRLAKFYARPRTGAKIHVESSWSRHIIWGNHKIGGGILDPGGNAWELGTQWGVAKQDDGDNIVWGTDSDGDNIVWGTDSDGDNIVWGTDDSDNIVWGTDDSDNIVWGTDSDGDNIVWGTDDSDNIVWGTDCGGDDCDNIVWGTDDSDNIVWGTANAADNIIWRSDDGDNIVWGTDDSDNIVWGTDDSDNIVWGTASKDNVVWAFYRKGGK
jgi:serine protease AprX